MRRGAVLPNDLADLEFTKLADHHRTDKQADDESAQARRRGAERDVARHVEDGELRVQRVEQVVAASGELRLQPIDHHVGADAARAFDQDEIARPCRVRRPCRPPPHCWPTWTPTAAAGMPAGNGRVGESLRGASSDGDEQVETGRGRRRAARFGAARARGSPSSSISPSTAILRALPLAPLTSRSARRSADGLEL